MKIERIVHGFERPVLLTGILLACLLAPRGLAQEDLQGTMVAQKDLGPPGDLVIDYLEYSGVELTEVVRFLGNFSGLNIMVGDGVEGKVSCHFEKVTVKDALQSILATNSCGYMVTGNVVQVRPAADLGEETVETVTRVYVLQYLSAQEVEETLGRIFSGGGGGGAAAAGGQSGGGGKSVTGVPGANAIIVNDTPGRVAAIIDLIKSIDRKQKQVMIDAKLVEVSYDFSRAIGIDWGAFQGSSPEDRVDVNLGNTPDAMSGLAGQAMQWQFGVVRDDFDIQAFIQMQDDVTDLRVLANPRILSLHNRTAEIKITDDRPYVEQTIDEGTITQSVQYQTTGITLTVTPRINDDGYVTMEVKPSQRIAGPSIFLGGSTAFSVDERSAKTDLILKDGQTGVIGGLRRQDTQKVTRKIPFFGDIPILGLAFRRNSDEIRESELLLFITPRIVVGEEMMTDVEAKRLNEFDNINLRVDQKKVEFKEELEKEKSRIDEKNEAKRTRLEKKEAAEARRLEEQGQ